jgi:glutamate synthase domain-containing protein 3
LSPRPSDGPSSSPPDAILAVPEIRDYELINKELARLLSSGARRIVLSGVDGQRLLASGLRGGWEATIVIEGNAGPELAASLDSSSVTVLCHGSAADGAGSGLRAGRLVIEGDAGDGLGYAQQGGTIVARGAVGHRTGLLQSGGLVVLLGSIGRLANERQSGGLFVARRERLGSDAGRGRSGGRILLIEPGQEPPVDDLDSLESIFLPSA